MPNIFGTSFFGGLSARLTRMLDLQGQVAPKVDIDAATVIVGLDASGLGYGDSLRGRQFVLRAGTGGGVAVGQINIRANVDVLIDTFSLTVRSGGAGGGFQARLYGTKDVMGVEPTSAGGVFFERAQLVTELAPLLVTTTTAAAPTGGVQLTSVTINPAITTQDVDASYALKIFPLVLGAGCGLVINGALTTDSVAVCFAGHVL